ncbi:MULTISPECIES: hypothetical protein [unclassified Mannheimia]|uniref:hypothetical protein n=1 Tax=unclassified Mannheimia TaxID=2645054 RepID=UPI00359DE5D2
MQQLITLDEFLLHLPKGRQDKIDKMSEELIAEIDLESIQSEKELAEKLGVFYIVH